MRGLHREKIRGELSSPENRMCTKEERQRKRLMKRFVPTSMELPPEKVAKFLDKDQLALYTLIWNRFVASQAAPALFDSTTADIRCGSLLFRVSGSIMKFEGFLKIYSEGKRKRDDSRRRG